MPTDHPPEDLSKEETIAKLRKTEEDKAWKQRELEEMLAKLRKTEEERDKAREQVEKLEKIDLKNSIAEMLAMFGDIPDMPRVESLKPHEHKGVAKYTVDEAFVTRADLSFEINTRETESGEQIKSFLTHERLVDDEAGNKILQYQNEATVADYVKGVVTMSLQSLGYFECCILCKEMTIYSLRPDLILVRHPEKGVILIIEVKMPGEELFESEHISAQVASYLILQYRLGNSTPLVLLSSYREACLCHLKPGSIGEADTNEVTSTQSTYRDIVAEGVKLCKAGNLAEAFGEQKTEGNNVKPASSPTKKAFGDRSKIPVSVPTAQDGRGQKRCKEPPSLKVLSPEVVYSKPFDLKNMMQGVSLSVACGIASLKNKKSGISDKPWPSHGSFIDGLHPFVDKDSLQWARVAGLRIDYIKVSLSKSDDDEKYLLVREVGRGKNGRVYLAADKQGIGCALKFYEGKAEAETGFEPAVCQAKRKDFLETTKKTVERELGLWKTLQDAKYFRYLELLVLSGTYVLKMPVFSPVPQKDRVDLLPVVKEKLLAFFHHDVGGGKEGRYVYEEVRWQHIGCRRLEGGNGADNLEIVLLDLESLKEAPSDATAESIIDKQIKSLFDRADKEPTTHQGCPISV